MSPRSRGAKRVVDIFGKFSIPLMDVFFRLPPKEAHTTAQRLLLPPTTSALRVCRRCLDEDMPLQG